MPEYQYKDHLGNLRVSFRDQEDEVFNATIESNATTNGQPENRVFDFIDDTRDGTQKRTGFSSSKLTTTQPIGMWKSLPVTKGDKVTVKVYGKYVSPPTNNNISLIPFINPLPATMPASEGNNNPTWLRAGLIAFPVSYSTSPNVPKSYLRGQFFDKAGNFVRAVPVVPLLSGSAWQLMSFDFEAEIEGTLQIFVANESDAPVWYDDMEITWDKALIAQENHYYPFGMNMVGIEKRGMPEDRFQYNGKEKQDEFGLNWADYGARFYDNALGRWHSVDPLANTTCNWSPYTYVADNPVLLIDPDGRKWVNPHAQPLMDALNDAMTGNFDFEKISNLANSFTKTQKVLSDIEKNDKELYDYVENLQFKGGQVNVTLYLSKEDKSSTNQQASTNFTIGKVAEDSYLFKGAITDDLIDNSSYISPPSKQYNRINIILYNSRESATTSGIPLDEVLANEIGDVMFLATYPKKAYQSGIDELKGVPYKDLKNTKYSFKVEEVYRSRKKGETKYLHSTVTYPLIYENDIFKTQNGTIIK